MNEKSCKGYTRDFTEIFVEDKMLFGSKELSSKTALIPHKIWVVIATQYRSEIRIRVRENR